MSIILHSHLYGCHGNIIIMLPWQPSNMFVTSQYIHMTIDLRKDIQPTTMVAMATVTQGNTSYCLLLDSGSVYMQHNFVPD